MIVADLAGTHDVSEVSELESILSKRFDGKNSFWMAHDSNLCPTLTLVVKGDIASLWYVPKERNAGCNSVGTMPGLDPNGSTTFSISDHTADDIEVLNQFLIPFSKALTAATEFFVTKERPQSVEWFEL